MLVMFRTGSNAELTLKYEMDKVQNDISKSKHIYKLTNIPGFQLCYPCKNLARFARSPIIFININTVDPKFNSFGLTDSTCHFFMLPLSNQIHNINIYVCDFTRIII